MQIVHALGAAEKRGPLIQDTFVSKFISELRLSNSPISEDIKSIHDFSTILRHVYHSISSESKLFKLNLLVKIDDQLFNSISFPHCRAIRDDLVSSPPQTPLNNFQSTNNIVNDLRNVSWFHGGLTRDQSEELLEYEDNGRHIPTHETFVQLKRPIKYQARPNIEAMTSPSSIDQSWMHGRIPQEHVQIYLKDEGDFLVWQRDYEYILSYVYNGEIQSIFASKSNEEYFTTDLIAGNFDDITDLVQHLILHHSYYRGVYLKTPIGKHIQHTHSLRSDVRDITASPQVLNISPSMDSTTDPFWFRRSETHDKLIDLSISLTEQRWFSKSITYDLSNAVLKKEGDFLVRTSQSRPGHLSLSVRVGEDIQTFGVFISGKPCRYSLDPHSKTTFGNVVELINHYLQTKQPLPGSLYPSAFLLNPINVQSALNSLKYC
ncbi:hypothetical protein LOD99_11314 [Oopsacas minuta]|uniref:SH2 domain-containing protein n=1 Tax=Oopsacas minuta TaxID=111878 RepID=A0AAV7K724_9METZ|nr:hypothetical protein LOD99_11314 [Oopsacas minuta]